MKRKSLVFTSLLALTGCSANKVLPQASNIELVNIAPNFSKCSYLGEVVGSQGNWFTGDFTSNENLMVGARNELKNEAFKLGGNIVYVQELRNTNAHQSLGTTNTTAIGKVYKCQRN
ncbi:DUF4156 domain-containing protein [Spartinivicinus poritis]|uniref:DUF4156 domain-containing protein n=1 Tax=Spartinivicinus poritis TaxID=2994640 RepID=A0ABT5U912_9GAMM|nr:DUF4156 domain-containing protein [Spartinivicinus sp. A2-2]MDE1462864.1 DUF4156 domain-containing protein [Spartinivicinus sp. A2-2]